MGNSIRQRGNSINRLDHRGFRFYAICRWYYWKGYIMRLQTVNGQFCKSVGFSMKGGKRKQRRWYLGTDEAAAIVKAAKLQTAWREGANVAATPQGQVWQDDFTLDLADEKPDQTRERLEGQGKVVVGDEGQNEITLAAALQWYYGNLAKRLTLRNRSSVQQQTLTKLGYNISACLRPFPQYVLLSQLQTDAIKRIHDYWMGTNHGNRPNARKETVGERTAINYLNSLKSFLRAAATNSDYDYELPKEIGAWRFALKPSEVFIPTIRELGIIYKAASDRMKCFILIALNAGQLAGDIGRMTPEDVTLHNGHSCIRKVRLKTQQKVTYKGSWQLWKETVKAIEKNKAESGEYLFANKLGLPLYQIRERAKSDAIGDEFHRLVAGLIKEGKPVRDGVTFSTLRAFGATWIATKAKAEYFAKLYLAHSVASGATRHYVDAQYEPLQPYLKQLRQALTFI